MPLSKEELLKPRVIVENTYPLCPFAPNEIICQPSAQQTLWANQFPYLFRWLVWHEERNDEDLPKYVKGIKGINKGKYYKVADKSQNFRRFHVEGEMEHIHLQDYGEFYEPITEQEYEEQQSRVNV